MSEALIELQHITKTFPGVRAVDDVSLAINRGEVHALVGENGAGKSTLIKVLSGAHRPDIGTIVLDGAATDFRSPTEAQRGGISIIYQEFNLIPTLSIADNLYLGHEYSQKLSGYINRAATEKSARELLERVGLSYSPQTPVKDLTLSERQLVEIAKALSYDARLIIMDEPTAALGDGEVARLFDIIRQLKAQHITIVYVSHHLEEIFEIADRVTVMRDGRKIDTRPITELTERAIIRMMVGKDLAEETHMPPQGAKKPLLELHSIGNRTGLAGITFSVHEGEILGIAGLIGAGQTSLAKTIFGVHKVESGEMRFRGKPVRWTSPSDAISAGIGFVPEDRKTEALFLGRSLRENLSIVRIERFTDLLKAVLNLQRDRQNATELVNRLSIATPGLEQTTQNLSGGNQQKVVLGKWLSVRPTLLILDKPTRGVDVGAKSEIHRILRELAGQGVGLIMISLELPELLELSDRIVVMHEGRVAGELSRAEANKSRILELALGGSVTSLSVAMEEVNAS